MGWPLGVAGGCQVTRREVEFRVDTVTFNGTDGTMCVCQREREREREREKVIYYIL